MIEAELGSTGAFAMFVFQGLSAVNGRNPFREPPPGPEVGVPSDMLAHPANVPYCGFCCANTEFAPKQRIKMEIIDSAVNEKQAPAGLLRSVEFIKITSQCLVV
jgi:hypothetical protein